MGWGKKKVPNTVCWGVNSHNTPGRKAWLPPFLLKNEVIPGEDNQVVERGFRLIILPLDCRLFFLGLLPSLLSVLFPSYSTRRFQFWRKALVQIGAQPLAGWRWVVPCSLFWVAPKLRRRGALTSLSCYTAFPLPWTWGTPRQIWGAASVLSFLHLSPPFLCAGIGCICRHPCGHTIFSVPSYSFVFLISGHIKCTLLTVGSVQ